MIRSLSRKRSEETRIDEPRAKPRTFSSSNQPKPSSSLSQSFFRHQKPENLSLLESFSNVYPSEELFPDQTVYKFLPSLKKKNLPPSFLSVKHAQDMTSKLMPSRTKKVLKTTKRLEKLQKLQESQKIDLKEEQDQFEKAKSLSLIQPLPLSMFDPVLDEKSPRSMIESKRSSDCKTYAFSKWFLSDGSCVWKKCIVEKWDEKKQKFAIVWPEGGKKLASRINLRFEDEDPEQFERRINEAKKYKTSVENTYQYNLFISNFIKNEPPVSIKVLGKILLFMQGKNLVELEKYRKVLEFHTKDSKEIHNPQKFLWKCENSHFIEESFTGKGFESFDELLEKTIQNFEPLSLFMFQGIRIVAFEKVKNLVNEYKDNWKLVCKHIDYKSRKTQPFRVKPFWPTKTYETQKNSQMFIECLRYMNENHMHNDRTRILVSQKLNEILLLWEDLRVSPKYQKAIYLEELKVLNEKSFEYFLKEAQNAIFDIQYEIQSYLTQEDQKRIKKNEQKLKSKAYSKQFVELEEKLPQNMLDLYQKFVFMCNLKVEDSIRRIILKSLLELNHTLLEPINVLSWKLSSGVPLKKEDFELSGQLNRGLFKLDLGIDSYSKTFKLSPAGVQYCSTITRFIQNMFKKVASLGCLYTSQTGSARQSGYLKISTEYPAKTQKILDSIIQNLSLHQQLLQDFMTCLEKFNFVLKLKPGEMSKKFEGDLNIDAVEDEIFRLKRIKVDIHELLGKNGRSLGIWKIFSAATLSNVAEIIDKGIDEMVKVLLAESLKNVFQVEAVYSEVVKIVKHIPKDLEELEEIRRFLLHEFSLKLEFIDQGVQKIMTIIEILESYWRLIPYEVYERCWNCLSFSANLKTYKEKSLKTLESLIQSFTASLHLQKSQLFEAIDVMSSNLQVLKKQDNYEDYEKFALECQKLEMGLQEASETTKVVNNRELIISQPVTDFTLLSDIKSEFTPYCKIWFFIRDFEDQLPHWYDDKLITVNREKIAADIVSCVNELGKLERTVLKHEPAPLRLIKTLLAKLSQFRPYLPVIKCVNNPGMKERHWLELRSQVGLDLSRSSHFTLRDLINLKILNHLEQLEAVSDLATKEMGLENAKKKMENEWLSIKFQLSPYKSSFVLTNTDVIWETLNEHLMRTIAMSASPYISFIQNEISIWKSNLLKIQEVLEEWEKFQKNWQYLQPIFTNADITKQLPTPAGKFRNINIQWEIIMHNVSINPNVYDYCTSGPKIHETLLGGNETLDFILKSLNEYLMCKRKIFPRFYFLSNEELIMILSNSQNIVTIQKYIVKCFEAISSVSVQQAHIVGMISPEGEQVRFEELVELYVDEEIKSIEVWMVDLEKEMRESLQKQLIAALEDFFNDDIRTWVNNWPSQLVQTSLMAVWTRNVEEGIHNNSLAELLAREEEFLSVLVNAVRGDLNPLERLTFSTLVVLDVHSKDVISNLIARQVQHIEDFAWFSHMRYYLNDQTMLIKMLDCSRTYGYEYLGNSSRLVITELTDRCYRTLMSALNLSLGGAPEGPAGTGKTETTKDLAKSLAKKCVVFNCSDRLDHIYMAKFFTGLCYCGAWACFDEFNRIELEVLSVIAEQILSIQTAVQKQARSFYMEEDFTQLDPTCAIFITMNPDYAGRTKLPDNLKALFRPVAMMVPDYSMIAEICLYSFGFRQARVLSQKITNSLRLASEQLSTQPHYDYGMRAVSTIIKAAGWLKQHASEATEEKIVLKAIKTSNIPKFFNQDLPLFDGIVKDLFPEVSEDSQQDPIEELISFAIIDCKLVENKKFFDKVIQVYSTILMRHGLMIIGKTMAGKSTALTVLSKALNYQNPTMTCHINPKSITLAELYGSPDPISLDWKDGILAQSIRSFSDSNSSGFKWIVLDGPVDALWIESMNTVMDDNKKLCLPNGEIIKLTELIRIIIEVDSLANASPATISRCGMIYIDSEDVLGPSVLISQWCSYPPFNFLAPRYKKLFQDLFESIFLPCLDHWARVLEKQKDWSRSHVTKNMINLFECLIISKGKSRKQHDHDISEENASRNSLKPETSDENSDLGKGNLIEKIISKNALQQELKAIIQPVETEKEKEKLTNLFVFAVFWTLGGSCVEQKRGIMSEFLKTLSENFIKVPENFEDFFYSEAFNEWKPFKDLLFEPLHDSEISNIFVPTVSLVSYKFLINELIPRKVSIVVSGETGTGKTALLKNILLELDKSFQVAYTMFTSSSSSGDVQNFLEMHLARIRKGFLGLEVNKFRVFMIDDLSMPGKERFGAQPAVELLRTAIDRHELYDRATLELKTLENVQYVAAMGVQAGSNGISSRCLSHFFISVFSQYHSSSLFIVLSTLLTLGLAGHNLEIKACIDQLARGTIELYYKTLNLLPPTPLKNHYVFNFRDLSNVLKGIFCVAPAKMQESSILVKLWTHECLRVFSDRLVGLGDLRVFKNALSEVLEKEFLCEFKILDDEPVFLNYLYENTYQLVPSLHRAKKVLKESLEDYNHDNPEYKLNLIFFDYAVQHINRISRVLAWNNGNLLLIGVGGSSGRTSLTKLAAYIQKISVFQIKLTKTYNFNEWTEDIKSVLTMTGLENKKLVFLIRNNEIIKESFLEVINCILSTGYYHDVFTQEEISGINESMKMNRKLNLMSKEERWEVFLANIKRNLHIVICMFPEGDSLRTRIREYPSLVNCCTIDWFFDWPEDGLQAIAHYFFESESIVPEKSKSPSIKFCVNFHESVKQLSEEYFSECRRMYFVTPAHYIQQLKTLKKLYKIKEETTIKQSHKYSMGISKLNKTQTHVQELRKELLELKPVLQQQTQVVHEILKNIQRENLEADVKREFVKNEQEASQAQTLMAEQIKKECQEALDKALPELEAAIRALDTLKRDDIDQVKSMREPPDTIKLVLEALAIINKLKPVRINDPKNPGLGQLDFYEAGKKFLSVPKFIQKLKTFDRSSLDEETISKITPYMDMPKFYPDIVKNASRAAEGLCKWVRAMYKYYHVNKEVMPKQASLKIAEADLIEKSRLLKIKQDELVKIEEIIAEMQNKLNLKMAEAKSLSDQITKVELHLDRAVKLIDQLGGERESWTLKVKQYEKDMENLLGDVLLSAACITYLGPFSWSYREKCVKDLWVPFILNDGSIQCNPDFSFASSVAEPITVQKWNLSGLPSDKVSIENAIIIQLSIMYPLIIDPQRQAIKWLIKTLSQTKTSYYKTRFDDNDFNYILDNSLLLGSSLIIEDVKDSIDPLLDPLLLKQFFIHEGMKVVKIGDISRPFDEKFSLFLFTPYPNPNFSPELFTKTTILNFSITEEALTEQLLNLICRFEIPRETEERSRLVVQSVKYIKNMLLLEEKILELLQSGGENILESEELINSLTQSKEVSKEVEKKLANSKNAEQKISNFQGVYRPVSRVSAVLYFCIADLANIDCMYQYSMAWFVNIFKKALIDAEKSKDVNERLKNIRIKFRELVFEAIFHSLQDQDRVLFAFLICVRVLLSEKEMQPWQWRFYLTGICGVTEELRNPTDFLTDKMWREVCQLDIQVKGLREHLLKNPEAWKTFVNTDKPWVQLPSFEDFSAILPSSYLFTTPITRLLIFRALKPESLVVAVKSFIKSYLGEQFLVPKVLNIETVVEELTPVKPLILILTPGNDPQSLIQRYAGENGWALKTASLGKGQGEKTEKIIKDAVFAGSWVLIQNCHLALSWLPTVEKLIEELSLGPSSSYHKDFRLILTSSPAEGFPSLLLQKSLKVIVQPPGGLCSSLLDIYSTIISSRNETEYYESSSKPHEWKKLFFALCFFHCAIRERRLFGPIGWNVKYEFNDSDLRISYKQLFLMVESFEDLPFEALQYLTANCNYGGRVTDDWDRRTLNELLRQSYRYEVITSGKVAAVAGYEMFQFDRIQDIVDQIKKFPQVQSPEVFGLHPNAEISKAIRESQELCSRLLALQPQAVSISFDEQKNTILSMISSILGKISNIFNLSEIREKYPGTYHESLSIVLFQELTRYNQLIETIRNTLLILKKAYEGAILITFEYEVLAESLLKNKVPEAWNRVSFNTCKNLASYIEDLNKRIKFFEDWVSKGRPSVFWISGFFFTQSFLTGVLQEFARSRVIPIDTLRFSFEILKTFPSHSAEIGAFIHGLFLEGAGWDGEYLKESNPRELYLEFPVIWLKPVQSPDNLETGEYECPVYRTLLRSGVLTSTGHSNNYIFAINLKSRVDSSHWIKRGVALFTQLDD